jgi:hypothetical protein
MLGPHVIGPRSRPEIPAMSGASQQFSAGKDLRFVDEGGRRSCLQNSTITKARRRDPAGFARNKLPWEEAFVAAVWLSEITVD